MIAEISWKPGGSGPPPALLGDFNQWEPESGVAENDRLVWRYEVQPDARLEYCFLTHDDRLVPDPANPFGVPNGLGVMSELVMPAYRYHPVFEHCRDGRLAGTSHLEKRIVLSRSLGYDKEVWVYSCGDVALPVAAIAVFNDGLDYLEYAHAEAVIRHLHEKGAIPPVTALFVNPPNRHAGKKPDRMTEYGMNPSYAAFLAEELVPDFRRAGQTVAVIGASYGGLSAIHTAWSYPEVFDAAGSQSGYVGFNRDALLAMAGKTGTQLNTGAAGASQNTAASGEAADANKKVFIVAEIGTWERSVGRTFLDPAELDFLDANRRFHRLLNEPGIDHVYREFNEGHTWGFWRSGLLRMLPELLKGGRS